jgi:hypothetical protein
MTTQDIMTLSNDFATLKARYWCHDEGVTGGMVFAAMDALQSAIEALQADAQRYRAVYDAAKGLCMGVDWNKGTHAKAYRQKLNRAVAAIDAAMALDKR